MGLSEKIKVIAERARDTRHMLSTEEATKNGLIMPFLAALGYDVFDPREVVPEFVADLKTKKGEKVDYAIKKGDEIIILVEAKKVGEDLSAVHAGQLYRYFSVTSARIAILTNGHRYQFYSDIEAPNKMDEVPFLDINLLDFREGAIKQLEKLTKGAFDLEDILGAATSLKNLGQVRSLLEQQLVEPDEEFVKYFFCKVNTNGRFVQSVKDEFGAMVKQAFQDLVSDKVTQRLRSALASEDQISLHADSPEAAQPTGEPDSEITTTEEELEGYRTVRAIVCNVLPLDRITYRDAKSYFAILVDDNNRKPLCRLHFNRSKKYLGVTDDTRRETKYPLSRMEDLYLHADLLRTTAARYANTDICTVEALDAVPPKEMAEAVPSA